MMARAAASTLEAECTDAVVTLKMQTDLAHRRESMYGYRGAAILSVKTHEKLAQKGRVHIQMMAAFCHGQQAT
jgi:hypothetical protein